MVFWLRFLIKGLDWVLVRWLRGVLGGSSFGKVINTSAMEVFIMCECDFLVVGALANRNDFGSVLLFLLKHNGEDTVFEFGFDSAFIFLDWNRQGDGAREFAPIAFLNVPGGSIFIFPAA